MIEPLTQAHIVTRNPLPIFMSNFLGGSLAGMTAAYLGIVNNAPGTASPVPGLLSSIAFNSPEKLLIAALATAIAGLVGGIIGHRIYLHFFSKRVPIQACPE